MMFLAVHLLAHSVKNSKTVERHVILYKNKRIDKQTEKMCQARSNMDTTTIENTKICAKKDNIAICVMHIHDLRQQIYIITFLCILEQILSKYIRHSTHTNQDLQTDRQKEEMCQTRPNARTPPKNIKISDTKYSFFIF